jgi:hypothetical protein
MKLAGGCFGAPHEGSADLYCDGAQRQRGGDAICIRNSTGCDYRNLHGIDDLRKKRERSHLRGNVVGQKHTAMAAGFKALCHHGVSAVTFEPNRLLNCGRASNDDDSSGGFHTREQVR